MSTQTGSESTAELVKREILRLSTDANKSADPVILVRWCIDREELKKLKEQGARNLHILLVSKGSTSNSEKRYLIPAERAMKYISFNKSGEHVVSATIVWCPDEKVRDMRAILLQKTSNYYYDRQVLKYETSELREEGTLMDEANCPDIGRASFEINIAKELFAKEPSKWVNKWANMWHETKKRDQCHLRGRCFGIPFKLIVMLFYSIGIILIRIAIAAFLFSIGKSADIRPVAYPLEKDHDDVYCNSRRSIFRNQLLWQFTPLPWIILIAILSTAHYFIGSMTTISTEHILGLDVFAMSTIPFIGLLFLTAIVCMPLILLTELIFAGIFLIALKIIETVMDSKGKGSFDKWLKEKSKAKKEKKKSAKKRRKELEEERKREAFKSAYRGYEELSCPSIPQKVSLDALPKHRQTLSLKFDWLKEKLCKPFEI